MSIKGRLTPPPTILVVLGPPCLNVPDQRRPLRRPHWWGRRSKIILKAMFSRSRHSPEWFLCMNSFHLQGNPMRWLLLFTFIYHLGTRGGTERLNNPPRTTELLRGEVRICPMPSSGPSQEQVLRTDRMPGRVLGTRSKCSRYACDDSPGGDF